MPPIRVEWDEIREDGAFYVIAELQEEGKWEFWERESFEARWFQAGVTAERLAKVALLLKAEVDYAKYYDDEAYLLDHVGKRFRETGELDAPDFFTILIWKAERAKNHHKRRLKRIAAGTFENAVHQIASELHGGVDGKWGLQVLMSKWEFLLPTATAILTILYPDEFTVYDWRVCEELQIKYEPWQSRGFSDALWAHYEAFKQAVIDSPPAGLNLRDKDRFLIGRSTRKSIENDCED